MKAFLEHDRNGLLYGRGSECVPVTEQALDFANSGEAEEFRKMEHLRDVHPVTRMDPKLMARLSCRAPGAYQVGE
jgi:hypothetical protein